MIELIREQDSGPLFPMKWWMVNMEYTVNVSYEPSRCIVSIIDSTNKSIVEDILERELLKTPFKVEKAPIGGLLIAINEIDVDGFLIELEKMLA